MARLDDGEVVLRLAEGCIAFKCKSGPTLVQKNSERQMLTVAARYRLEAPARAKLRNSLMTRLFMQIINKNSVKSLLFELIGRDICRAMFLGNLRVFAMLHTNFLELWKFSEHSRHEARKYLQFRQNKLATVPLREFSRNLIKINNFLEKLLQKPDAA